MCCPAAVLKVPNHYIRLYLKIVLHVSNFFFLNSQVILVRNQGGPFAFQERLFKAE
jgi:hypothetical protein